MYSRRRNTIFHGLLLTCTFAMAAAGTYTLLRPADPAPAAPATASISVPLYTARVQENRVVICSQTQTQPFLITEIDVRTLPDADRQALEDGIPLENDEALAHLLEDFDG